MNTIFKNVIYLKQCISPFTKAALYKRLARDGHCNHGAQRDSALRTPLCRNRPVPTVLLSEHSATSA